jgi:hypothetical protein
VFSLKSAVGDTVCKSLAAQQGQSQAMEVWKVDSMGWTRREAQRTSLHSSPLLQQDSWEVFHCLRNGQITAMRGRSSESWKGELTWDTQGSLRTEGAAAGGQSRETTDAREVRGPA